MVKAIETFYKGYRFRSRLEARWAVFFDSLGVKYKYEPEGYDLGEGLYYLPDFFLPDVHGGTWVEIKGEMTDDDREKIHKFQGALWEQNYEGANYGIPGEMMIAVGEIPEDGYDLCDEIYRDDHGLWDYYSPGWDFPYVPCVCPICGKFGFEYDGRGARICRHNSDDKGYSYDHPKIKAAFSAARQARFEHGEIPKLIRSQ